MLKGVTKTFIDGCNDISLSYEEYIVLDNEEIQIEADYKDDAYNDGNFVGTFILKQISFEASNEYDFMNKSFEYYKKVNGESIKIGTFFTTEITDNDTTQIVKVVAMDYGLKTQIEYKSALNYAGGTVTLLDVWNECCDLSGVQSGITEFTNSDFIVDSDQFTGNGATIRDVFIAIAQSACSFVKIMNDDKIYLLLNEATTDIIEDYTELDDKRDTHPITCVRLGLSQAEGENVDAKDEELVEEYGENWLIINDNPFAYTVTKRSQLINNILNKIKGFGYSAFTSKTSFKPYLTTGDVIQFKNSEGELINSIILRFEHKGNEITLEAPSETSAEVNYVMPTLDLDIIKRTQIIVDKQEGTITNLTQTTQNIQENITNNYYTVTQTNELVQNAKDGLINTYTTQGGNNILRNTGLWFEDETVRNLVYPNTNLYPATDLFTGEDANYEYWVGYLKKGTNDSATGYNSILLQNGTAYQEQKVPNGTYTLSFMYKNLSSVTEASVTINENTYTLTETSNYTEFYTGKTDSDGEYITKPINVTTGSIKVSFFCNVENGCEIYDLMLNKGSEKSTYSQNQNETTTDTVQIGKGITITSTDTDTIFKANADGIRMLDNNKNVKTKFTDKGMETDEAVIHDEAKICGTLIQEVGEQTWFTRM